MVSDMDITYRCKNKSVVWLIEYYNIFSVTDSIVSIS